MRADSGYNVCDAGDIQQGATQLYLRVSPGCLGTEVSTAMINSFQHRKLHVSDLTSSSSIYQHKNVFLSYNYIVNIYIFLCF